MKGNELFDQAIRKLEERSSWSTGPVYCFCRFLSVVYVHMAHKITVRGKGNIPRKGPVIIAGNHQSFIDPLLLTVGSGRTVIYLARRTLFVHPLFSALISRLLAVPVARGGVSTELFRGIRRVLQAGWSVALFPEGTRTRDGAVGRLRRGASLIAAQSGVPVIPARISGAFRAWPRHKKFPSPGKITVAFGPLLLYDKTSDTFDSFTERLGNEIKALPHQPE